MIYQLSHSQKKAVSIMFIELSMEVEEIVESFMNEGYPVNRLQVEGALYAMKEEAA